MNGTGSGVPITPSCMVAEGVYSHILKAQLGREPLFDPIMAYVRCLLYVFLDPPPRPWTNMKSIKGSVARGSWLVEQSEAKWSPKIVVDFVKFHKADTLNAARNLSQRRIAFR
ncbi:hypothetical protein EMCG_08035 [[Emmonsia] crescens]|uniref:Uncharacterized protein n=1 Tax=[Emmonsia] crescens TaxID=73230 RepID=A0A0G2J4Y5_9EURO|nr:hypothetical protein EMCG_08035 [Emmonsia crescens UAMH 3008]